MTQKSDKKKIILAFDSYSNRDIRNWTKEAVENFINLFPEYKDNFEIEFEKRPRTYSKEEVEKVVEKYLKQNPSGSADDIWQKYKPLKNGSFAVRMEFVQGSVDWAIKKSKNTDGKVDLGLWLDAQKNGETLVDKTTPIKIAIANCKTTMGYGIGCELGACISSKMCGNDKNHFQNIIMHEFGHIFRATTPERKNTVENLGSHCLDDACLMYEYAYKRENIQKINDKKEKGEAIFCNDCIQAMRPLSAVFSL